MLITSFLFRAALQLGRRLLYSLPAVFIVVTLVFVLIHLVPGDPVEQMMGENARSTDVVAMRRAMGLDLPLAEQYGLYWKHLAAGDLGTSIRFNSSVSAVIFEHYPATVEL